MQKSCQVLSFSSICTKKVRLILKRRTLISFIAVKSQLCVRQSKPLDVAEVLTVRQECILGIHTNGTLVLSGLLRCVLHLEGVVVAFLLHHLQRLDREDVVLAVLIGIDVDLLECNGIVESLLVDDVAEEMSLASW